MSSATTEKAVGTTRLIDRVGMAHDASHYLLIPEVVITATDTAQVANTMAQAYRENRTVTFRSGGTSLSGQSLSDSILLDVRKNFRKVEVLDGGARVRCQPGATIRNVNAHLARYGYKLGPDPASEIACTIGGVVADNSSGMACGTQFNTYNTLESMVLVLPSGTVIDTAQPDADAKLHRAEPALWEGLSELRDRVRKNPESVAKITQQYAMKNTMGYGINSFTDHDEPVHILEHLMIGSEGTLGFVAEVTFRTLPVQKHAATALLIVPELSVATDALEDLVRNGALCLELMDAASLRVVQKYPEASPELAALDVKKDAGLLIEAVADDEKELDDRMDALNSVLGGLPIANPPRFTKNIPERNNLWQLRKGLYTSVAGARPAGTTNLLEDIAVPVGSLTATSAELQDIFAKHGYDDAVIFGHAKDGNIHFMVTSDWRNPVDVEKYRDFTEDMVNAVLRHEGTLKAEHGTGRVMAPFVERQWGAELYDVMKTVRRLGDPHGVLNPGTLLTDDPEGHMHHFKMMPPVDDFVDRCVECGYCEPTCPSADLTQTPRRRIALLRSAEELPRAGQGTAQGLRLRGRRHLRRRLAVPAGLPAAHRHRRVHEDLPRRTPHGHLEDRHERRRQGMGPHRHLPARCTERGRRGAQPDHDRRHGCRARRAAQGRHPQGRQRPSRWRPEASRTRVDLTGRLRVLPQLHGLAVRARQGRLQGRRGRGLREAGGRCRPARPHPGEHLGPVLRHRVGVEGLHQGR